MLRSLSRASAEGLAIAVGALLIFASVTAGRIILRERQEERRADEAAASRAAHERRMAEQEAQERARLAA